MPSGFGGAGTVPAGLAGSNSTSAPKSTYEFAKENQERGMDLVEATIAAARQRLRPILMTSMAFVLGVLPLAIATGAGAGGRVAIGTGVIGGMLTATVLAVFLVPVFFVRVRGTFRARRASATPQPSVQLAPEH